MTAPPAGTPDIASIFDAFTSFHRTAALKGALELGVFGAVSEGATTAAAIAERCAASERGTRILCDRLVVDGFLTKEDGRYGLSTLAAVFLDPHSSAFVGSAIEFIASPLMFQAFSDVAGTVRKGGTLVEESGAVAPDHPMWVQFARAMAPLAGVSAEFLAALLDARAGTPWKVLDVAAGHGLFGIALAKHNPRAEITALDWQNVLAVAEENARAAGVADRLRTIPGSAFTADYGSGYDLVLLTNILHHFDPATCEALLRRVHAALAPGGRAVTLEMIPDENRVTPPSPSAFSLVMLATTPGGDAYTFAEYERMFRAAGFSRSELHDLPPTFQRVVISHR